MRWVRAWTHLRKLRVDRVDGWPLLHVNGPSRDTEIVTLDPGRPAFDALAQRVAHDRRAMLTVFGHDLSAYGAPHLPGLRVDRDDEVFMTTRLVSSSSPVPTGLSPRWIITGTRATYCVDGAGRLAAEGTAGVLGADAVFDAVETSPSFRRRGLGRHVMGELATWAISQGASRGLLAASADGAELYASRGWDARLAMLSLMGTDD